MVIERGEIWWADLPEPRGSSPGYEHPIVVTQANFLNQTSINTVIGKSQLLEYVGTLSETKMGQIDKGLRLVLSL